MGTDNPIPELIEVIADIENEDPSNLEQTLYGTIDLDALRQLAHHSASEWAVRFSYKDHEIAVCGDGEVQVDGEVWEDWTSDASIH